MCALSTITMWLTQLVLGTLLGLMFSGLCRKKEEAATDVWNRAPGKR